MDIILEHCKDCTRQALQPGTLLLREGERSGRLLILAEGALEVFRDEVEITVIDEPGAIFGEMSVLLDVPHTASVRALTPSIVHVVEDPQAFLAANPAVAVPIATLLAQRLQNVTNYLVDLKQQFRDQEGHLGMVDEVLESLSHDQGDKFIPTAALPVEP
jgi:CRP-like cAMP-binding protein